MGTANAAAAAALQQRTVSSLGLRIARATASRDERIYTRNAEVGTRQKYVAD
jgi:hypothetical protein